MKKYSILIAALLGLTLTACEDVPAPYEVIFNEDDNTGYEGAALPFTSANLSAGFEIYTPSDYPSLASWSTGSSYVQITGYVDADGDGTKEYNLTQSWLISPALYTATTESLVLNFDYTIRYANSMNAAELAANHKVMVSKDYTGDVALANWQVLDFTPKASPYTDWTLYGSGDIEIPKEYQNCDNVHVAFYYQVTDLKKVSTWELQNLMIYAGIPEVQPEQPEESDEPKALPWTSASLNDFKAVTVKGIDWSLGSTYAKASGYANSTYTETDAWLVSPPFNTKTNSGVIVDVQHVIRYTNSEADLARHTMWASTDYDGDVSKATWTKLNYKPQASPTNSWDFYPAKTVGLPESLLNKEKVYIAYRYECTSSSASTWELKEFSIKEGTAPDDGGDPDPGTPAEEITIGEFLAKADPNTTYRLTGTVQNISNTQFGNFDLVDETGSVYIYGLLDKDGNAKNFESLGIKEGDTLTLEGKYKDYNGKAEIANAQYISHVSGGDDPGPGTPAEQITIADFLAKADPNTTYRLTGKVSNITNTQYGNFDLTDATGTIYIYGLLDKEGNPKNFESLGIKEGDEITIEGKYTTYNDNPQIKNAQYISGGSGGDDPGPGTTVEQITIADFLAKADANTTYRLTGTVSNITNTQYGNFDLTDATGTIYVYGLLDKDGNPKNFESLGIKEGDEITIEGKYNEYNGNPQIKNAQYISGGSGSGGEDPEIPPTGEYITLSFAENVFGIDSEKQTETKTYTYGNYSITITPAGEGNSFYYNTSSQYFILGKQDATLEFNGFDFAVSAIEITGRDAASASVVQNIFVGDNAVSTQTTGAKGTNVYNIASDYRAAGTHYTLKVLSNHNTQITEVKVYKAQ
ncbi:MAG: choice-of-anchor J domain-containing protein [Bacteroidales bacterium]|nr:choice-of-anchor J domain-containing protein [Bacteroidales bacterium]